MNEENEFKEYLMKRHSCDAYVKQNLDNLRYFSEWLKTASIPEFLMVTKAVILSYVEFMRLIPLSTATINSRVVSLRKFYDYLISQGAISKNPALAIQVGRRKVKVVENPLSEPMLSDIYQRFEAYLDSRPKPLRITKEADEFTKLRYRVMIGLLIYQGLDTGELDRLCISDFDLRKGTIFISPRTRRKSRFLKLEAFQILPISQYLQFLPAKQEKAFSFRVQSNISSFLALLKGIEPQIKNLEHIRQSRILAWVSTYKLRDAQYMIGHKYVSSTEGYINQNTSELVDEINRLHLFR